MVVGAENHEALGDIEPEYYSWERVQYHLGRLLKDFPFFSDLERDVLGHVPKIASYAFFPAQSVLFHQGDEPDLCYLLLTGRVDVWKNDIPEAPDPSSPNSPSGSPSRGGGSPTSNLPVMGGCAAVQKKCAAVAHMLARAHDESGAPLAPITSSAQLSERSVTLTRVVRRSMLSPEVTPEEPEALVAEPQGGGGGSTTVEIPRVPVADAVPEEAAGEAADESEDQGASSPSTPAAKRKHGVRVALLGPGSLFGELALLEDKRRNATITCDQDCEMVVFTKANFEFVLKSSLRKHHEDKLLFLRQHVPGTQGLADGKIDDIAYLLKPVKVPKNHVFMKQGNYSEGVVYFVARGSVEFRMDSLPQAPVFSGLPEVGHRRIGVLAPGGMFGSLATDRYEPFSVVASSSPCNVYRFSREDARRLPEPVVRGMRSLLESQSSWRVARCDSPASSDLLGTVPKMLARPPGAGGPRRRQQPRRAPLAVPESGSMWDMAPGEILALKGCLPRQLPGSKSAPDLAPAGTGRPFSRPSTSMSASSYSSL